MKDKIVIAGYGAVGQAYEYLLERFNFKVNEQSLNSTVKRIAKNDVERLKNNFENYNFENPSDNYNLENTLFNEISKFLLEKYTNPKLRLAYS